MVINKDRNIRLSKKSKMSKGYKTGVQHMEANDQGTIDEDRN